MFYILNLSTNLPVRNEQDETVVFEDGDAAMAEAKRLVQETGDKHQPRVFKVDTEWRLREARRLIDGTYTPLPWDTCASYKLREESCAIGAYDYLLHSWFYQNRVEEARYHYPHVSKIPSNVSFTENASRGERDIQTSMKIGRYLERFYPGINRHDRGYLTSDFISRYGEIKLEFAITADEIEEIYTSGPNSCMSHVASDYPSKIHPVRVYGDSDLQLAYIAVKNEEGKRMRISSRALVYPADGVYGRIYGDVTRMEKLLHEANYRPDWPIGAKIKKIKRRGGKSYIMPYLDGDLGVISHDKNYWKIVDFEDAEYRCNTTNGLINCQYVCENCGDEVNSLIGVIENGNWCRNCCEEYTFYCCSCGDRFAHSQVSIYTVMPDDRPYCEYCYADHCGTCDATETYWRNRDLIHMHNGECWSYRYFSDHGTCCTVCGENVSREQYDECITKLDAGIDNLECEVASNNP